MLCCYWGGECDLKKWLGGGGDGASAVVHDVYKGPCGAKKVYEYLYKSPQGGGMGKEHFRHSLDQEREKTTIKGSEPYSQKMCLIALSSFPVCFGKYRKPVKYPTMYFNCIPLFVFAKIWYSKRDKKITRNKKGRGKYGNGAYLLFSRQMRLFCAQLQISSNVICNVYHVIVHFLPHKHYLTQKSTFLSKVFQKVPLSSSHCQAYSFSLQNCQRERMRLIWTLLKF